MAISILERFFYYPRLAKIYKILYGDLIQNPVILDVGANRGQSINFFQKHFEGCKIYAFEPLPKLAEKLKKLENHQIQVIERAVGSSNGETLFWVSQLEETSSLIMPNAASKWNKTKSLILGKHPSEMFTSISVDCCTLDKFFLEMIESEIFFLKVDVEGAEYSVLLGAEKLLKEGLIHYLQIEQHENDMRANHSNEIQGYLTNLGYSRIFHIKHSFGNFYDDIYERSSIQIPSTNTTVVNI
jgi:FkbM family methyltransferase